MAAVRGVADHAGVPVDPADLAAAGTEAAVGMAVVTVADDQVVAARAVERPGVRQGTALPCADALLSVCWRRRAMKVPISAAGSGRL